MSEDQKHIKSHDDLNAAFDSGKIFTATDEDFERYLSALGSLEIKSDEVRSKAIVRALVINHLQMRRLIGILEQKNKVTQRWFMVLAIGSLIVGVLAVLY